MAKTTPIPDAQIAFLLVTGICSGMSLAACGFILLTCVTIHLLEVAWQPHSHTHSEGPSLRLTGDHDRQRFLALVSFVAAICGLLGNGLEVGAHGANAGQSTMSFFFNYLVQIGLAVVVHNTLIRFLAAHARALSPGALRRASQAALALYLLPLPVLSPTLIALTQPQNADVKIVARYLNIALVCAAEALAGASDVYLLRRFTEHKTGGARIRRKMIREMVVVYACIWVSIAADIAAKVRPSLPLFPPSPHPSRTQADWEQITRNETGLLIADLTITNLTLSLRALANVQYGATLKLAQEKYEHALSGSSYRDLELPPQRARVATLDFKTVQHPDEAAKGERSVLDIRGEGSFGTFGHSAAPTESGASAA
ncbi:hypothetical protein HWV62_28042 [Athelia sp. TMB]|nr:hypothetical protein HWV62_28042 [Athelia sp. TMB]